MEDKINVVFEVSKLIVNSDFKENINWLKFISKFISESNKNVNFYFLLNFKESESEDNFEINFNKSKEEICSYLKSNIDNFSLYSINFGVFVNPENVDNNKITFFDFKNNLQIELSNNNSIFFFSYFELSDFLHINNFFSYFLDFDNTDADKKKIKRLAKEVNGIVDEDNFESINFLTINYEFLTFIDNFKNN
ncbi:hypothetical protein D8X55_01060 [Malacoplasma penetrans]|uniref:Uncharacterized protein n=1 Tax=Malacoplasma penetrans (strain HF-2) TaxID=272633 RepID=Q8EVS3_MALP2|nr:hypothetical protein [Malacoplasma penetrans]RXY97273.1 hypothetical protein D8X55_01060 [Malacoplasma penetrans]BAC44276.1 hypothetical protein [Malacoplasma penetrans HF-2]